MLLSGKPPLVERWVTTWVQTAKSLIECPDPDEALIIFGNRGNGVAEQAIGLTLLILIISEGIGFPVETAQSRIFGTNPDNAGSVFIDNFDVVTHQTF
jgi:hypothetical protein